MEDDNAPSPKNNEREAVAFAARILMEIRKNLNVGTVYPVIDEAMSILGGIIAHAQVEDYQPGVLVTFTSPFTANNMFQSVSIADDGIIWAIGTRSGNRSYTGEPIWDATEVDFKEQMRRIGDKEWEGLGKWEVEIVELELTNKGKPLTEEFRYSGRMIENLGDSWIINEKSVIHVWEDEYEIGHRDHVSIEQTPITKFIKFNLPDRY